MADTSVATALRRACRYINDCDLEGCVPNPEFYQAASRLVTTYLRATVNPVVEVEIKEVGLRNELLHHFQAAREIAESIDANQLMQMCPTCAREAAVALQRAAKK